MKRTAALFLAAALTSASPAHADTTSFAEYETMTNDEQGILVNNTLARLYDHYSKQGRADVNQCMVNLFLTAPASGGLPEGHIAFASVIDHFQHTDVAPEETPSIERILFNIVSSRCVEQDIANTPDAPVITPPAPPATPG